MIDSNFINPFLSATLNVLKVQAEISAEAGKIYLKKTGEEMIGDVSGVIGIISNTFNGSVSITFPEGTFLKIMSAMLGEEYTVLDQELVDGAGEISNMIFGQAKIQLNERGYGIKMALPQVIAGKNHRLTSLSKGPTVVVPFTSTAGNFFVEVLLSE